VQLNFIYNPKLIVAHACVFALPLDPARKHGHLTVPEDFPVAVTGNIPRRRPSIHGKYGRRRRRVARKGEDNQQISWSQL
jgi:hypothetical protein